MNPYDWSRFFLFFHLLAAMAVVALPIAVGAVLRELREPAMPMIVQPTQWVARVHRVSLGGVALAVLTGLGQMWAFGIGWDALTNSQRWLLLKVVLVILLILNGALLAGPVLRRLEALVQSSSTSADQDTAIRRGTRLLLISSAPQALLILAIVSLAILKPF